ncbi:MAG: helix-turn-helix domain-containing protein [Bacteroidales bacterium]|nr:helix-turn-helix domain-containing protein [Bacteroidales bacterium]
MRRYKLDGTYFYCPVDLTLSVIGGRWKSLVFWNLRDGAKRYSELKRILVGINDKMLSQVLKELEISGIVSRKDYSTIPPKVEYSLTEEGLRLLPVMKLMEEWGAKFEVIASDVNTIEEN